MGTTLVVNPGSSSKKYALYVDGQMALELRFENTKIGFELCTKVAGATQTCSAVREEEFNDAFLTVARLVFEHLQNGANSRELDAVVVRVVAPGTEFQKHAYIDAAYVRALEVLQTSAPLHVPTILREIAGAKKHFFGIPLYAASDSAFHATLPNKARLYSLPATDSKEHDIYRFGYHGLSVASVVRKIHGVIGIDPEKMVVCHIGNGSSVTAVFDGKSVETTMGFSPTSGLPMGSRMGELDAAALLQVMRVKNFKPTEAELYISTRGGLHGLTGESDIRQILDRKAQGDESAIAALEVLSYHIKKAIAASTVALGGLDVLVLTATAAVRSAQLRAVILGGLEHLGVQLSPERNEVLVGKDGVISVRNSPVKVVVVKTDEMGEMALVPEHLAVAKQPK